MSSSLSWHLDHPAVNKTQIHTSSPDLFSKQQTFHLTASLQYLTETPKWRRPKCPPFNNLFLCSLSYLSKWHYYPTSSLSHTCTRYSWHLCCPFSCLKSFLILSNLPPEHVLNSSICLIHNHLYLRYHAKFLQKPSNYYPCLHSNCHSNTRLVFKKHL